MNDEGLKCDCEFEQQSHNTEQLFGQCSKEELIKQIQQLTSTVNTLIDEKEILQYQLEFQKYIIINNNETTGNDAHLVPVPEVTDLEGNFIGKQLSSNNSILQELHTDPFPSNVIFDGDDDHESNCVSEINSTAAGTIDDNNLSSDGLEISLQFEDLAENDWITRVNEVDIEKGVIGTNIHLEVIPYDVVPPVGQEQVVTTTVPATITLLNETRAPPSPSDFQCHICPNSYKYHFSLKRHLSQHHNISSFVFSRKIIEQKCIDNSPASEEATDCPETEVCMAENIDDHCSTNQDDSKNKENTEDVNFTNTKPKKKRRKKKIVNLICELCGQSFKYLYNYQRHVKKLHCNNDEFPCSICSKVFPSHKSLRRHQNEVHFTNPEDKHFQCHICLELFKYHYLLQRHTARVHDLASRVSCSLCSKTYATEYHLRRHLVLHQKNGSNEKEKIQGGGRGGSPSNSSIRRRPRGHGESFICEYCGKVFPKRNRLVQHCVSHADEKPFSCTLCEKSFTRKAKLLQHQATRHCAVIPPSGRRKRRNQEKQVTK